MRFAAPVREQHCELRLAPREDGGQRLLALTLVTEPASEPLGRLDCFGNLVHGLDVQAPHEELGISLKAEVERHQGVDADLRPLAIGRERAWLEEALRAQPRLLDYLVHRSLAVPELERLGPASAFPASPMGEPVMESTRRALAWIGETMSYDDSARAASTDLSEAWARRRGDSQDLAHLLIALLRAWRVPARYLTGYLALPSAAAGPEGLRDLRAWVEVLIPNAGWRGFDPVRGVPVDEAYLPVASGRDGADVPGVRCSFKGDVLAPVPERRVRVQRSPGRSRTGPCARAGRDRPPCC